LTQIVTFTHPPVNKGLFEKKFFNNRPSGVPKILDIVYVGMCSRFWQGGVLEGGGGVEEFLVFPASKAPESLFPRRHSVKVGMSRASPQMLSKW